MPTDSKDNVDRLLEAAKQAGITRPQELANFMGQMRVESRDFSRLEENLHYSATGLVQTFHKRNGLNEESAQAAVAKGPEAVANAVYGGKWGRDKLGNVAPDDGWTYRGRGFVQLTGRDQYQAYGNMTGLDLVKHPDLAAQEDHATSIAIAYWKDRVSRLGHELDVGKATHDVNGSMKDVEERRTAAAKWDERLAAGYGIGSLAEGDHGRQVKQAQADLAVLGYADPHGRPLKAEGSFGPGTGAAVRSWQGAEHVAMTGILDADAVQRLHAQAEARRASRPEQDAGATTSSRETVRQGLAASGHADARQPLATDGVAGAATGRTDAATPAQVGGTRLAEAADTGARAPGDPWRQMLDRYRAAAETRPEAASSGDHARPGQDPHAVADALWGSVAARAPADPAQPRQRPPAEDAQAARADAFWKQVADRAPAAARSVEQEPQQRAGLRR